MRPLTYVGVLLCAICLIAPAAADESKEQGTYPRLRFDLRDVNHESKRITITQTYRRSADDEPQRRQFALKPGGKLYDGRFVYRRLRKLRLTRPSGIVIGWDEVELEDVVRGKRFTVGSKTPVIIYQPDSGT